MSRLPTSLILLLCLALGACATRPGPSPTPLPAPTVPAVAEVMANPKAGEVRLLGYLLVDGEGASLSDGLSLSGPAGPAPIYANGIWLGEPPTLPPDTALSEAEGVRYTIVIASGSLEGPGAFGPGERYRYRLLQPRVELLGVRELNMRLLLDNTGLYAGQIVRLNGALLADDAGAVLVERLGAGGVPESSALQIKLAPAIRDEALLQRLNAAGDGRIRYGPVTVTGIWRGTHLYPLLIVAASQ